MVTIAVNQRLVAKLVIPGETLVMSTTRIEWTEATWNPVTGCTKVSAGCAHCYAERMAKRLRAMGQVNYARGFEVVCHSRVLEYPLRWKGRRSIFVNSMSDLFHEAVPAEFIGAVFGVMERASWHRFQVLTKREGRLAAMASELTWTCRWCRWCRWGRAGERWRGFFSATRVGLGGVARTPPRPYRDAERRDKGVPPGRLGRRGTSRGPSGRGGGWLGSVTQA